jgi:hypothetical protein
VKSGCIFPILIRLLPIFGCCTICPTLTSASSGCGWKDSGCHTEAWAICSLKPDWLATAISFVLDDKQTRDAHGLVSFAGLGQLWDDPETAAEFHYPPTLHTVFIRLMERFDLSYCVTELLDRDQPDGTNLIAQLVPDVRPDSVPGWGANAADGDEQQVQLCRIVEVGNGRSAYEKSVHW